MSAAAIPMQIEKLLTQSGRALMKADVFEAERLADEALQIAFKHRHYDCMIHALEPLAAARAQRIDLACNSGVVEIIDGDLPDEEELKLAAGCYLVQPPRVAADARRLRVAAWHARSAVFILTREPQTQLGLVPVVAIAPGTTIRTLVDPPANAAAPELAWLINAHEELGDASIDALDAEMALPREIEALMNMLNALPEHDGLHAALEDACRAFIEHHSASA